MSKRISIEKEKKRKHDNYEGRVPTKAEKAYMKKIRKDLKNYLEMLDKYIIIDGLTKEEYDSAVKKVKKLIKLLKRGEFDNVFDGVVFDQAVESGKIQLGE